VFCIAGEPIRGQSGRQTRLERPHLLSNLERRQYLCQQMVALQLNQTIYVWYSAGVKKPRRRILGKRGFRVSDSLSRRTYAAIVSSLPAFRHRHPPLPDGVRMLAHGIPNRERTLVLLAGVLAVVMFVLPLAISFPLVDPDEGLHASIAQEMAERGDWLVPRFIGQPFFDKPIFYFWVQAASIRLLGSTETAVRLPGLLFGLLGAVTTGLLGRRLFDRTTGWIAGILYATTILPTALAQVASHDVALIPWINLSLLLLWQLDRSAAWRTTILCILGAGICLGLAVLTKGLSGVALVAVAFGGYLLMARRLRLAILLRGAAALIVTVLIASPWYLAVESQNPGYLHYYFLQRHLLGFATDSQPHSIESWWYYLPVLLGGGLPWIGYLPVVIRNRWDKRKRPEAFPLLWCWLIGWTLLMTLAGSKLTTYLWPVFPAVALLASTAWAGLIQGTLTPLARQSFTRTFIWSSWSGPIMLPAALLVVQMAVGLRFGWQAWLFVGLAAAAAPLPLLPWRTDRSTHALATAALSLALQFVAIMTTVLPTVAETFSARDLADYFNRQGRLPGHLYVAEGRIGSLAFYLDPKLRASLTPDQLRLAPRGLSPDLREGDAVVVPARRVNKMQAYIHLDSVPHQAVGPYRLYEITSTANPLPNG